MEAQDLLPHMLELAKQCKASVFSIAALAVIKAYVETSPGLAPWVGSMLTQEGMHMLAMAKPLQGSNMAPTAMPTTSIH